jgi:hypothetical protein
MWKKGSGSKKSHDSDKHLELCPILVGYSAIAFSPDCLGVPFARVRT